MVCSVFEALPSERVEFFIGGIEKAAVGACKTLGY
jgi:hypothetical protein